MKGQCTALIPIAMAIGARMRRGQSTCAQPATSDGRTYAFAGLVRMGGIVVFDVTDPYAVPLMGYASYRDFGVTIVLDSDPASAGDLGHEGIRLIPANESPTDDSMIAMANEISGTTTLYSMSAVLFRNGFD